MIEHADVALALICDLYRQVVQLQQRNDELEQQLAQARSQAGAASG